MKEAVEDKAAEERDSAVISPGQPCTQALAALGAARKESKLDVKHFWEMVDLGAVIENAAELAEEPEEGHEA